MTNLKVVIEPKSPLVLGSGMDIKNVRTSCEFIAGSVLRGAIAQVILDALGARKNAGKEVLVEPRDRAIYETFRSLFLGSDPVHFSYLYPARVEAVRAFKVDSFPIPITALTCKPSPGFGPQDKGHVVLDRLLPALRRVVDPFKRSESEIGPRRCPECQERMEQLRGFTCREVNESARSYSRVTVPKKQFIKVGLNRWTEAAEEGILYVLEAILPKERDPEGETRPVTFVGSWTLKSTQQTAMEDVLHRFFLPDADGYKLRIGSARARGMGEVILRVQEVVPHLSSLDQRLESFQPRHTDGSFVDPEHIYFSLTMRSPVLVLNNFAQSTVKLTPEVLNSYLTATPEGIELVEQATFVERTMLSGWSQAWGLPKPVLPAIAAGSVFTFKVKRTAANLAGENVLFDFLKNLEENGVGERRSEGLGDVIICDPFHVDCDPEKLRGFD